MKREDLNSRCKQHKDKMLLFCQQLQRMGQPRFALKQKELCIEFDHILTGIEDCLRAMANEVTASVNTSPARKVKVTQS